MSKDKFKHIDTVILGAGLAGLSAAYHRDGVIFEKENQIGGTCRSLRARGFIFDFGIHVLHTKNNYVLKLLAKDKNLSLKHKNRSAWIYSHGVLTKYPFQVNTFGLPKEIIRQCLAGFKNAIKKDRRNYDNYRDWIYANFGKGIAENFYIPYSEKFWTVKTKELTTDWLDARVPRPRLEQVIAGATPIQRQEFGPNAEFQYPQHHGIQEVTKALLRKNTKVFFGKEAIKIEPEKKKVRFNDGAVVCYNKLISTIPLPELAKIIATVPGRVKEAVKGLRHNSVLCVNLGIKRENITPMHWIYFPEKKYAAFRVSFPGNFSRFVVPKGWSSAQAEISYSKSQPIRHRDIVEKIINDLIKVKIIHPKDKVELINLHDIKYAYVIYDHNRLDNLEVINKFLRKNSIYNAGRYGQWEYLWMDEAILSGKNIIRDIMK